MTQSTGVGSLYAVYKMMRDPQIIRVSDKLLMGDNDMLITDLDLPANKSSELIAISEALLYYPSPFTTLQYYVTPDKYKDYKIYLFIYPKTNLNTIFVVPSYIGPDEAMSLLIGHGRVRSPQVYDPSYKLVKSDELSREKLIEYSAQADRLVIIFNRSSLMIHGE